MDERALNLVRSELLIGGQRSGKSARAERLARAWLALSPGHDAVLIATATAYDDEMRARIERHRQDRAVRVPAMRTVEEPLALADTVAGQSTPATLVVVDCLTLWLTNWLMPADGAAPMEPPHSAPVEALRAAVAAAPGPVVLISNEIGLGVIPMGRETRAFVDAQGRLNQMLAAICRRVTFMAAGLAMTLKDE